MSPAPLVVISGGFGYVGYAIATRLASQGMRVALLYRHSTHDEVAKQLSALSSEGHRAFASDIGDATALSTVLDEIEHTMGPISACVHAAGVLPKPKQLHLSDTGDIEEQINASVIPAFNFLSLCSQRIKKNGGGVVVGITTAGVASGHNTKARGVYSLVKFAVQGILVALREELATHGVRVYSVAPGVLPGGLNKATPQAFLDIVREKTPHKKLATADDVAEKVSYLISDAAKDVTTLTHLVAPECTAI